MGTTPHSVVSSARRNRSKQPHALIKQSQMTRNKNQTGDLVMSPIAGLAPNGGKTQEVLADAVTSSLKRRADILPKLPQAHTSGLEGGSAIHTTAHDDTLNHHYNLTAGSSYLTDSGSGSSAVGCKTSSGGLAAKDHPKSQSSPKPLRNSQIASFRFSKQQQQQQMSNKNAPEPSQGPPRLPPTTTSLSGPAAASAITSLHQTTNSSKSEHHQNQ